uniref:Venom protein n=1 Tax=Ampulex compressa TaxID=860918 RepID=A0A1W6EVW3_AMPCP|nr:venom protein [Ampulex compressa]
MTSAAFSKMVTWIALAYLLAACNAIPVVEESGNATTVKNVENTPAVTPSPEVKGHSMDDIMPGTKAPPIPVTFIDVPVHTETELGSSVLLACRTSNPVAECQWSWQPLPPVHLPLPDISESPTASSTTLLPVTTTTTTPTTHPLPVRQFPAFGNNSNDCSVRFSSTKHEQTGYWTCAARSSTSDPFTSTEPAMLSIVNENQGLQITFAKHESVVEVPAGSSAQIMCRTKSPVRECQWSWRQLNQSQLWNLEVKRFPAFGNDSTECSIKFKNVLSEQEGYWTCGARIDPNSSFTQSNPIRFLISEVEFVQLSRGVQVAAGESVFLRCLANKPVVQCEWSWKPSNNSGQAVMVKKFNPNKDTDHDCSVRFKNILYEEEGLWTCGVRLAPEGILHEAPSATVSLLPTAKVSFVETPTDTSVPIGTEATLKCVTSSRVEKCTWTWKPLHGNDPEIVAQEFPSHGDLGRDCSLNLAHVYAEKQGHWGCQVSISSLNTMLSSPFAKLTVFEQDEVKFSELSQDIQISSGGSVLLRCVTSSAVEQCRWSLTPVNSNTTVVVKQFPAGGSEARDCSVRLSQALAEQEGLWTCGARVRGRQEYIDAPPAKLSLLEPEPVTIAIWAAPHQAVTLACRVGVVQPEIQCHWIHAPKIHVQQNTNSTGKKVRHHVQMDYSTGICTLAFKPDRSDLGDWTCRFSLANNNTDMELGSATLVLMNTSPDEKLGWIVGALTAVILFLMIIVVVLVVCKGRLFIRKTPKLLDTSSSLDKTQNVGCNGERYTKGPAKLDFQFSEQENQNIDNVLPNRSPHLYERVGKCRGMTPKLYENVRV